MFEALLVQPGNVPSGAIEFPHWLVAGVFLSLLAGVGVALSTYIHEWVRIRVVKKTGGTRNSGPGNDPWIDRFLASQEKSSEVNALLAKNLEHLIQTTEQTMKGVELTQHALSDLMERQEVTHRETVRMVSTVVTALQAIQAHANKL